MLLSSDRVLDFILYMRLYRGYVRVILGLYGGYVGVI